MFSALRTTFFLGIRSTLRGNLGIAVMTILMMALIYINLLFIPSLIQGAIQKISDQVIDTTTSNFVITSTDGSGSIKDVASFQQQLEDIDGVEATTATYRIGNQVDYSNRSVTATIEAINPESYAEVFTTPSNIYEGEFLDQQSSELFMGIDIAGADQEELRGYAASLQTVHPGEVVTATIAGTKKDIVVSGIYRNQFPLSDQKVFITVDFAKSINPLIEDTATSIYLRLTDDADAGQVASQIRAVRDDIDAQSSDVLTGAVQDQIDTFELINSILKVISLLVAAITVFIITYVDLVNKRRQIGIERAIGIKPTVIVGSYVMKAMIYSVIGIGLGLLLFVTVITAFVKRHPFNFPNGDVVLVSSWDQMASNITILLIVAIVAALVPSIQSVRIKILDAIWGK